jgi:hypothetical protein
MAMPAIIGLSSSSVHSSFVKLDLSATTALLETFEAALDISLARGTGRESSFNASDRQELAAIRRARHMVGGCDPSRESDGCSVEAVLI